MAFEFFYRFSRFEFALKENGYLRKRKTGEPAEPCWEQFIEKYKDEIEFSDAAKKILVAPPKQQVMVENGGCDWREIDMSGKSEIAKVTRMAQIVRNNLFHGGKYSLDGWDDPTRTRLLLEQGIDILECLGRVSDIEPDYHRSNLFLKQVSNRRLNRPF